jgi:dUTP pyrophosphatase
MINVRGFELVNNFKDGRSGFLPTRATQHSAGYDFYSPTSVYVPAMQQMLIWSNVKAYMQEWEVLQIYVRSSTGIKKGLMLANGTGIIDKDYYNNIDNEGNIGICLFNRTNKDVKIERGERIAQGIFINYLVADNGNSEEIRNGGIGSSNL